MSNNSGVKKESREDYLRRIAGGKGFDDGKRGDNFELPTKSVMRGGRTVERFVTNEELRSYLVGYLQGLQSSGLPNGMRVTYECRAASELSELY